MIGLKRGTVVLVPHCPQWHALAAETVSILKELLGDAAVDVQHVGSTAISGIRAKPILDIAVAVRELDDIQPYTELLHQKGIVYRKQDVTGQLLFVMGDFEADTRTHHIHVVRAGDQAWRNYLNFRDYLNAFPEKARGYDALKGQLFAQFAQDRSSYTKGKQALITRLLEEAAAWRGEMGALTNQEIWKIALRQSAYDCNCAPEDFLRSENVITISKAHTKARKYLPLPFACDLVSYGSNIVAQTNEELATVVRQYLDRFPAEHCFETPHLHALDDLLQPFGLRVCFMAEYFLPDVDAVKALPCRYELGILHQEDFSNLYLPQWSNALCEKRKELDVLGIGAYDKGELVGLAGCSADCEQMYQIGVDVLPQYRRQGIAAALTSRLALEILKLGKVPFYCAAWCNLKSVRNAIKCGFRPAWVEVTAREMGFVDKLNGNLSES